MPLLPKHHRTAGVPCKLCYEASVDLLAKVTKGSSVIHSLEILFGFVNPLTKFNWKEKKLRIYLLEKSSLII